MNIEGFVIILFRNNFRYCLFKLIWGKVVWEENMGIQDLMVFIKAWNNFRDFYFHNIFNLIISYHLSPLFLSRNTRITIFLWFFFCNRLALTQNPSLVLFLLAQPDHKHLFQFSLVYTEPQKQTAILSLSLVAHFGFWNGVRWRVCISWVLFLKDFSSSTRDLEFESFMYFLGLSSWKYMVFEFGCF